MIHGVCMCVCVCSGPLLYIVQVMCTKDISRFLVLVFFVLLPFVGGLSWRFGNNKPVANGNTTGFEGNTTKYIHDATGFETFGVAGGSFLKMFVDVGEISPSYFFRWNLFFRS
jgi:hypothetical protein